MLQHYNISLKKLWLSTVSTAFQIMICDFVSWKYDTNNALYNDKIRLETYFQKNSNKSTYVYL